MIVKYYGGMLSIDTLAEMCKTSRSGASAYYIIKAAEEIGLKAEGIKCDSTSLIEEEIHLPVIAHVTIEKSYMHYVVIYEINKKNKYFLVADPAVGIKKISFYDFQKIYNETILTFIPQRKLLCEERNGNAYQTFFFLLQKYKKECTFFLSLSILFTIFSISTTYYLSSMTESISYRSSSYLLSIFIIFLLLYLGKSITYFFRNLILLYLHAKMDFVFTEDAFHNILSLPYRYYKNHTTGDIVSRINDISVIKDAISKFLVFVFVDLLLSFVSLCFLYKANSVFFKMALCCMFGLILLSIFVYKKASLQISAYQRQKSETVNRLFEYIHAFESIKGMNLQKQIEAKQQKENIKLLEKTNKITKLSIKISLLVEIIENMGYLCIIYYASKQIMKNAFEVDSLFTIIYLYQYFLAPMKNFLLEIPFYKEALFAYQRITSLFIKQKQKGYISFPIKGKIEVKNLSFSYLEENPLLNNVSFQIEKGEKVLLLGKSGVGKSSFFKLLKQYYPKERGSIFIDEIDINDYEESQIKQDIGYISQNETLFTATLYENIIFTENPNKRWLQEVLAITQLEPVIKKNPLGIYQYIEEGGYHLSGGEKQRIILARTLMRNFSILLIDEGFSEIDPPLERKIIQKLFQTYLQKTMIVVSHRIDNIDLYDKVIQFHPKKVTTYKKEANGNYSVV